MDLERRYPFKDAGGGYFYAGKASGGRLVLLFTRGDALLFDSDGNLIGSEHRDPPKPRSFRPGNEERFDLDRKQNVLSQLNAYWSTPAGKHSREDYAREHERIQETFFRPWLAEFGFQPGTIFVQKFDDPVTGMRVTDMPEHFAKFLTDPHAPFFDDEDRSDFPELIDEWLRRGMFVVRVGNNEWLWMDGDGDVDST